MNGYTAIKDMPKGSEMPVTFSGYDATLYREEGGSYRVVTSSGATFLYTENDPYYGIESLAMATSVEQGTKPTLTVKQDPNIAGLDSVSKAEFDRYAGKMKRDTNTDEYLNTNEFNEYLEQNKQEEPVVTTNNNSKNIFSGNSVPSGFSTYNDIKKMPKGSEMSVLFGGDEATLYKTDAGKYKVVTSDGRTYLYTNENTDYNVDELTKAISIEQGVTPTLTVKEDPNLVGTDSASKASFDRYEGKMKRDLNTDEYLNAEEFNAQLEAEKQRRQEMLPSLTGTTYDENYTFDNNLMNKNIVIDYGLNRPNQSDTYVEQESGDFHVNYRELIDSMDISLDMVEEAMNIQTVRDEYSIKSDKGNRLFGDDVENIVEDSSFYKELDTILNIEKYDEISTTISDLDKHLAGFINSLKSCSYEVFQLVDIYLSRNLTPKINEYLNDNDMNTATMVDYIIENYVNYNHLFLSEEELKDLRSILRVFHPGEYLEEDNRSDLQKTWDSAVVMVETFEPYVLKDFCRYVLDDDYRESVRKAAEENLIYGVDRKLENFADGVEGLTMSGLQYLYDETGNISALFVVGYLRQDIAVPKADINHEERIEEKGLDRSLVDGSFSEMFKNIGGITTEGGTKALLKLVGTPEALVVVITCPFDLGEKYEELAQNSKLSSADVSHIGFHNSIVELSTGVLGEFADDSVGGSVIINSVGSFADDFINYEIECAEQGKEVSWSEFITDYVQDENYLNTFASGASAFISKEAKLKNDKVNIRLKTKNSNYAKLEKVAFEKITKDENIEKALDKVVDVLKP